MQSINHDRHIFQSLVGLSIDQRQLLELLLKKQGEDLAQLKIPKRNLSDEIPLSYSQERVWKVAQLTPDSAVDNVPVGFHVIGDLNLCVFEQSINLLIRRNEILRTTCVTQQQTEQAVQVDFSPRFEVIDLSDFPVEERLENAIRQATHIAQQPFDLTRDILFRTSIYSLNENEYMLLLVAHQFVTDGLSFRFLLQELAMLYRTVLAGDLSTLSESAIQYADFSVWQRQWFTDAIFKSQIAYWNKQLHGTTPQLRLPVYQNCQYPTYRGASESIEFSTHHSNQLRTLCREQSVTVFMAVVALFQSILHCCTLENDICIGTLISNRNRREIERLIGNFSNNLLLRSTFSSNPSFCDLLAGVKKTTLDAYNHQDLPFQNLLDFVEGVPKFQVLLILRNSTTAQSLDLTNLEVRDLPIDLGLTRMELSLDLTDDGKSPIFGKLEYKTELFETGTIQQIVRNFQALLESVIADPMQKISDIQLPEVIDRFDTIDQVTVANQIQETVVVVPRNELEEKLVAIWEEILGIQPIGIQDNFFELGGNSLQAVQLFARIEQLTAKSLPLASLIQAPTIDKLANILNQEEDSESMSALVPIQPNGTKPPLFCIHGAGLNVLIYKDLADNLGPDYPVYGVQAFLPDGSAPHANQIDQVISYYLQEIRRCQPEGPYFLAGLSKGGNFALKIAQLLRVQGQDVALVAMFDSHGPNAHRILPPFPRLLSSLKYALRYSLPRTLTKLQKSNIKALLTHNQQIRNSRIEESKPQRQAEKDLRNVQGYSSQVSLQKFRFEVLERWMDQISQYILEHSPWVSVLDPLWGVDLTDGSEISAQLKKLRDAYEGIIYQSEIYEDYQGRIVLFRAMEEAPGYHVEPYLGWDTIAKQGVEVFKIPGDHVSLVRSQILANKLKAVLDKAIEETCCHL